MARLVLDRERGVDERVDRAAPLLAIVGCEKVLERVPELVARHHGEERRCALDELGIGFHVLGRHVDRARLVRRETVGDAAHGELVCSLVPSHIRPFPKSRPQVLHVSPDQRTSTYGRMSASI